MAQWAGALLHAPHYAHPQDAQKIQTVAQVFVICALLPGDRGRGRREPRSEVAQEQATDKREGQD